MAAVAQTRSSTLPDARRRRDAPRGRLRAVRIGRVWWSHGSWPRIGFTRSWSSLPAPRPKSSPTRKLPTHFTTALSQQGLRARSQSQPGSCSETTHCRMRPAACTSTRRRTPSSSTVAGCSALSASSRFWTLSRSFSLARKGWIMTIATLPLHGRPGAAPKPVPPVLDRRFEALVLLDWDGTAVPDRGSDVSHSPCCDRGGCALREWMSPC